MKVYQFLALIMIISQAVHSKTFFTKIKKLDLVLPRKKVGYIMGAGDLVYENLKSIGVNIELIDIDGMKMMI